MAVTMTEQARRRNVLFAALGYKIRKEFDREQLSPGSLRVQGVINATVGKALVEVPFAGELIVAPDQQTASSSAPDSTHVIAVLFSKLPEQTRLRLLEELPRKFEADGHLPAVAPQELKAVEQMLIRMRSSVTKTRKGNVVYQPHSPSEE